VTDGATTRYTRGFLIWLLASIRLRRDNPGFDVFCEALQDQPELLRTISRRLAGNSVQFPRPAYLEELFRDVRVYQAMERPDTTVMTQLRRELDLSDKDLSEIRERVDQQIRPHLQAILEMEEAP
jgi:hypothetical protein